MNLGFPFLIDQPYPEQHGSAGNEEDECVGFVAVVTGIYGNIRHMRILCRGRWSTAGACRAGCGAMRDFAVAHLIVRLDAAWQDFERGGDNVVITCGMIGTNPDDHAISRIPGEASLSLEIRAERNDTLERFYGRFEAECRALEAERDIRFEVDRRIVNTAAPMDGRWVKHLSGICTQLNLAHELLPSGAPATMPRRSFTPGYRLPCFHQKRAPSSQSARSHADGRLYGSDESAARGAMQSPARSGLIPRLQGKRARTKRGVMFNPRVPFQMATERVKLSPLKGKPIIVHIVVNVEYWPFDQPMPRKVLSTPHGVERIPDIPNYSWAEYGLRSGMPRMMKLFAQYNLPVSVNINAAVIDVYPSLAKAMRDAGWEFICHGMTQRLLHVEKDEAATIQACISKVQEFVKKKPRGWMGPGFAETFDTPDILKAAGIEYLLDWTIDDIPAG